MQGVRETLRGLRRAPGFAVTAVLTLACGIAATTSIFSVLNASVLRPLPYTNPAQLVELGQTIDPGTPEASVYFGITWPEIRFWRQQSQLFAGVQARDLSLAPERWREGGRNLQRGRFSAGLPSLLGITPILGRTFTREESESDAPVLLISEGIWDRGFGRSRDVIGAQMTLGNTPWTVIGVMPSAFRYGPAGGGLMDMWSGLPERGTSARPDADMTIAVGRLRDGLTADVATKIAAGLVAPVREQFFRPYNAPSVPHLGTFDEWRTRFAGAYTTSPLFTLLAVAGLVLLVGCVNVANLLWARSCARAQELQVRVALGARRSQLVRLLVMEGVVLSTLATVVGIALSAAMVPAAVALMPARMFDLLFGAGLPVIDVRVMAFAAGTSCLVALVASLLPALSQAKLHVTTMASGRVVGSSRRRWDRVLQACQVALALVLVAGAGLTARSVWEGTRAEIGFEIDRVGDVSVALPRETFTTPESRDEAAARVMAAASRVPGVTRAALGMSPVRYNSSHFAEVEGQPARRGPRLSLRTGIGPGYFATVGMRVLSGREFGPQDASGAPVVIVDANTATRLFGDGTAVGQRIKIDPRGEFHTVIGVVNDAATPDFIAEGQPLGMYLPWTPASAYVVSLVVSADRDVDAVIAEVATVVEAAAVGLRVTRAESAVSAMSRAGTYDAPRFIALLVGMFALVALGIAAVGVFALLTQSLATREREVGLRLALGAPLAHVRRLVIGEAAAPVMLGVVIGCVLTALLARFAEAYLYAVAPHDISTLMFGAAVMLIAALAAAIVPMRRATSVDPIAVLNRS